MQKTICSSRSTPRSAAPRVMSSRLTAAANEACFIFLRTPLASSPSKPRGPHEGTGRDESAQLVARVQRLVEKRDAGAVGQIVGMRLDRVDHVVRIMPLFEDCRSLERMIGRVGPAFVVEIVQEPDGAPLLLVFAVFAGVGPQRRLDGQHVPHEVFVFCVLANEGQVGITTHGGRLQV